MGEETENREASRVENRKFTESRYKKSKGGEKGRPRGEKCEEQIGVGTKVLAIPLGTLTVQPPPPDPVPPWPVSDPV